MRKAVLRVQRADLEVYLSAQGRALGFLSVAGLGPGKNWRFTINAVNHARPQLSVLIPAGISPEKLIDGSYPEMLWGTSVRVYRPGEAYELGDDGGLHPIQHDPNVQSADGDVVVVSDFMGARFRPEWTNNAAIASELREHSWLGSEAYRGASASVTLNTLGTKSVTSCLPKFGKPEEVLRFANDGRQLIFRPDARADGLRYRDARFGGPLQADNLTPIGRVLRRRGLTRGVVELSGSWPIQRQVLGAVTPTENMRPLIDDYVSVLEESLELKTLSESLWQKELQRQASRLNDRIISVQIAREVLWNGHYLGTVPESEQGTAALIHKLEALGGLPLPVYRSRGWAGADGIDAIADIQLDVAQAMHSAAPVEYEFRFENFLAHRHPHEHVRLVICWDSSSREAVQLQSVPHKPWLWSHTPQEGVAVPVITLSSIPGLSVRRPK